MTATPPSGTRNPERPILLACAAVGILFALLAVLERVGVDRDVLGALAVALPIVAVAVLATLGRTIDRLPFAVDGARGGTLAGGLALSAEWMGVWVVPVVVLVPLAGFGADGGVPVVLGTALGLFALVVLAAGSLRRMGTLSLPAFLVRRTGARIAGLLVWPAAFAAVAGLLLFQTALLHALLVPLIGSQANGVLMVFVALAALVCLVGGQRSLTLVNAFLAFFLALSMVVPALATLAGVDALSAALPLDRGFAQALPGIGGSAWLAVPTLLASSLAAFALPTFTVRLAAVRPGGLGQTGAWTLLAGYVTMSAATLAFAGAALAPGLAVTASGEPSILSVLPSLGWLGAVWAGLAMSLFSLAALVGQLSLGPRLPAPLWLAPGALVAMRFVFLAAPVLLWWALAVDVSLVSIASATLALAVALVASAGLLAPALLAATLWRHVTWPGIAAGQAAAALTAFALWGTLETLSLALAIGSMNLAALVLASLLTPRRFRPRPSLVLAIRDP